MKPVIDTKANKPQGTRHYLGEHEMRYVVDGVRFKSGHKVYRVAVENHGYTGPETRLTTRLQHGATTWAALLAAPGSANGANAMKAQRDASRIECARIAAAMDARKAAMPR